MHQQFNIQQLYVLPTLYLCVLYLSEKKTATCATYSINWLVFITEMKSVYCAVRTGSLNKAVCAPYLKTTFRKFLHFSTRSLRSGLQYKINTVLRLISTTTWKRIGYKRPVSVQLQSPSTLTQCQLYGSLIKMNIQPGYCRKDKNCGPCGQLNTSWKNICPVGSVTICCSPGQCLHPVLFQQALWASRNISASTVFKCDVIHHVPRGYGFKFQYWKLNVLGKICMVFLSPSRLTFL